MCECFCFVCVLVWWKLYDVMDEGILDDVEILLM